MPCRLLMNERASPDRFLATSGIHNLRDYGGYRAAGGRRVVAGRLYRSGHHADAGEADLAVVEGLELDHVVDFRGSSERERNACRRPDGFRAELHAYDGETASLAPHLEAAQDTLDVAGAHAAMERVYRTLPDRAPVLWVMRRYFEVLAREPVVTGATLVHCHAGKDRTGMAVYLLHHLLGVHEDDAMEEYLLTNHAPNNEERIASGFAGVKDRFRAADEETVRVLMGVDARYIWAMRREVESRHGSLDAFADDVLGVDPARRETLRFRLLED